LKFKFRDRALSWLIRVCSLGCLNIVVYTLNHSSLLGDLAEIFQVLF
jgi:hypothetical protein